MVLSLQRPALEDITSGSRCMRRGRSVEELQERWMDALNDNQTYFIIEIYPPMFDRPGDFGDGSGHYGAVSGIISIPI